MDREMIELAALKAASRTLSELSKLETNLGRRVALKDRAKELESEFNTTAAAMAVAERK